MECSASSLRRWLCVHNDSYEMTHNQINARVKDHKPTATMVVTTSSRPFHNRLAPAICLFSSRTSIKHSFLKHLSSCIFKSACFFFLRSSMASSSFIMVSCKDTFFQRSSIKHSFLKHLSSCIFKSACFFFLRSSMASSSFIMVSCKDTFFQRSSSVSPSCSILVSSLESTTESHVAIGTPILASSRSIGMSSSAWRSE
ncbi:hypothetical protein LOK49_LG10G03017 [Camellia lanceoleosa]|uniref:Uncharacterized protein n=1 Tax=Camellia lanceoleosa TaxID=1840588 RepID=A0ACC0GCZ4_9ERIC|nr:hypothetical protein LOK49_LG10G03017 [Camellia lanceoleosa]